MSTTSTIVGALNQCVECPEHELRLSRGELRQAETDEVLRSIQEQLSDLGAAVREQSSLLEKYLAEIAARMPPRRG